jgi:hypothetical protein
MAPGKTGSSRLSPNPALCLIHATLIERLEIRSHRLKLSPENPARYRERGSNQEAANVPATERSCRRHTF